MAKHDSNPKNKKQLLAKAKLAYAVKTGKLKKPKSCPKCGATGVRIIGDHRNGYEGANALKVEWKCDVCHGKTPERNGKVMSRAVKASLKKNGRHAKGE